MLRICRSRSHRLSAAGLSRVPWTSIIFFLAVLLCDGSTNLVHSQDLVISEFMAANSSGKQDEDGEFSDWIEIYNPGQEAVSLAGWSLTDDASDLSQWLFPELVVPGQGFAVVFASGKDRRDPKGPLHTNFKLEREGDYLALVRPDGRTPASHFSPAYPPQLTDISYGTTMSITAEQFVPFASSARMLVPGDGALGRSWTAPEFIDANWATAVAGVGYDRPEAADPVPVTPLVDVTRPGDSILGTSGNSPGGEEVDKAIDDNSRTKYLNFDKLNAGFTVRPASGPTVVTGLKFTSANDAPDRDPTSFLLLGSNDGQAFSEVARGQIPDFKDRFTTVEVAFTNVIAFARYRLLFPTIRDAGAAVAVQIAEVEFLGRMGPPPATFTELIKTSLESAMFSRTPSVYLRFPFIVQQARPLDRLALRVRYDDGFVAYLNGEEIARANCPATPIYNSAALTNRSRALAVMEERFDLNRFATLIKPGANVLAIQALNDAAGSPDFLFDAELVNTEVTFGEAGYFSGPSPGAENGPGTRGPISAVAASPGRGFYEAPMDIVLSCATDGATIRYTLDGTMPTATNGQIYANPIRIDRTTTLRTIASGEGWEPSSVVTHTYLFLNDVVTQTRTSTIAAGFPTTWNGQAVDYGLDPRVVGATGKDQYGGKYARTLKSDLQSVPTMSLVMDLEDLFGTEGIYSNPMNHGDAWEKAVSMELLYPDNRPGIQATAGIRIQGGAFRRFDLTLKKSFRIIFREKYGSKVLRYPLFGPTATDEFDNFILRANSNDAWPYFGGGSLYVRDAFAMESARAMGMVAPHTRFVHLYLNGVYWGLYNPVERPDAAFSAAYHGGDKESWDAINQDSVPDGNYDAWNRLQAQLNQGLSGTEAYQRVQGNNPDGSANPNYEDLLDVENMLDYMILNFYVGNTDWPGRNWWVGRDRDLGGGFQFYPWDTETALGVTGLDVDRTGVADAVARPYAAARANADFRMRFADHVFRHFSRGGAFYVNPASPSWVPAHPEDNQPAARFVALADQVSSALVGESARWGDQMNTGPFTRDEHWQKERENLLANYFPRRSAVVIEQFRRAGLYPRIDPPAMNQPGGRVAPGFELTLSAPSGTIFYTTDGSDPRVALSVTEVSRRTLVSATALKKALVPSVSNGGSTLGTRWQGAQEPFDDSSWGSGTGGVGYDQQTDYDPFIQFDLQAAMAGKNASVFIRIPFDYDGADLGKLNYMTLRVRYDDGFVAFLNGQRITAAKAPAEPQWDSIATGSNDDSAAVQFEEFPADDGLAALQPGRNILAIQGLNLSISSSDFLMGAELIAGERHIASGPITAVRYDGPIALQDLTTIKARAFSGSEWSALNEATFEVGTPALIVSELHYHPSGPNAAEIQAGFSNADEFEFIELFNPGTGTRDLSGLRFVTGVQFEFRGSAVTKLRPGEYVLVVKNRAAFELRYGSSWPVAGEYAGRLDNAGEPVELVDGENQTVLKLAYGTEAPWPKAADGDGPSMQLVGSAADLNAPTSWQASPTPGGSPGQAGLTTALQVQATQASGQLRLQFTGRPTLGYTIYVADSVLPEKWEILQRRQPTAGEQAVSVIVDIPIEASARFFRVSVP